MNEREGKGKELGEFEKNETLDKGEA